MTLKLQSLINETQTIDGTDIGPFETVQVVGTTVTSDIATAVVKRRLQCDVLAGGIAQWADAEGSALVKPTGDPVELGTGGASTFSELSDVPQYIGKAGYLHCVNQAEDALTYTNDGDCNVYLEASENKDASLVTSGTGTVYLSSGKDVELATTDDIRLLAASLSVNAVPALSQDIVIAGVGTLTFSLGILTGFVPV